MIDWWALIANSMWITAAALALAVVSVGYYQSQTKGVKLKTVLNRVGYLIALHAAGALFCVGMAATSDRWWETGLWAVVGILFGIQLYYLKNQENA